MSAVARRYYVRGTGALDKGDLEGALEALRAAIDLVPGFTGARIAYAVALARYGDTPRAAQTLRAGLARPSSPVAAASMWASLGDILTMSGDFPGAEDAFRQAQQHPSFEGRAHAGLARVHAKQGRYPDAFDHLSRAARMNRELGG